ncbi:hypothetical protein ACH5RR_029402 [Cinchona calisaya]|uniref:Uncharacterized protein n=1 Tax=Cinchona calisaya TaxID=153742 RepID=A0ABD2YSZ6_9GENT
MPIQMEKEKGLDVHESSKSKENNSVSVSEEIVAPFQLEVQSDKIFAQILEVSLTSQETQAQQHEDGEEGCMNSIEEVQMQTQQAKENSHLEFPVQPAHEENPNLFIDMG